jgi:hypothetical protein
MRAIRAARDAEHIGIRKRVAQHRLERRTDGGQPAARDGSEQDPGKPIEDEDIVGFGVGASEVSKRRRAAAKC